MITRLTFSFPRHRSGYTSYQVTSSIRNAGSTLASTCSATRGHELVTLLPVFSGNSNNAISAAPDENSITAARHRAGKTVPSIKESSNNIGSSLGALASDDRRLIGCASGRNEE